MSKMNGWWLRLKRMLTPASSKRSARAAWTKLRELPWGELLFYGAMLLALVWSLAGCATTSTPPDVMPRSPEPPPTRLSESPPDYLNDALRFISESRKTLNELMGKPAN